MSLHPALGEEPQGFPGVRALFYSENLNFHRREFT
jgi:hypothetical protein